MRPQLGLRVPRICGKRGWSFCGCAIGLLAVTGCAVGPNYRAPNTRVLDRWHGGPTSAPASQASVPLFGEQEITEWWTTFRDPVLDALVKQAVESNLDLLQAESRVRQARAVRDIAIGGLFPAISATSAYTRSETGKDLSPPITKPAKPDIATVIANILAEKGTGTGSGTSTTSGSTTTVLASTGPHSGFQAGFDAAWELDIFGGIRRSIEAAGANVKATIESRRGVLITLVSEVALNYIELRGFQQEIVIARENLAAQVHSADLTRRLLRNGLVSELDVANADAQVATTKSVIPVLEISVRQTIYTLSVLLGREPGALLQELSTQRPIPTTPPRVPIGLPSNLLRRRPDIRGAEAQLHAATAQIGVATAALFPQFSLTGSINLQGTKLESLGNWGNHIWSVGPSMNWPIFQGGSTVATIRVQNALQEQALLAYRQTVLTALQDVENALVAYAREQEHRVDLTEAVEANRKAVELSTRLYSLGRTDFLNVLNAQRSLFVAEDALVRSTGAVSTDLVALYKALGGGWEIETETGPKEATKSVLMPPTVDVSQTAASSLVPTTKPAIFPDAAVPPGATQVLDDRARGQVSRDEKRRPIFDSSGGGVRKGAFCCHRVSPRIFAA